MKVSPETSIALDCPTHLKEARDWFFSLFSLSDWRIGVNESNAPGGNVGYNGVWIPQARYSRARIEILHGLDEEERDRTLLHELSHALFARLDRTVEERIIELLPEDLREHARELYNDALEQSVEATARSLYAAYQQTKQAKEGKQ